MYASLIAQFSRNTRDCADRPRRMSDDKKHFLRNMLKDEMRELFESRSIMEDADALCDMIYYIVDQAIQHGINLDPVMMQVHRANMMKRFLDGTFHQRGDGKVIKPPDWTPPDHFIEANLNLQMQHGPFHPNWSFHEHIYLASPYSAKTQEEMIERYFAVTKVYIELLNHSGHIVFAPISFCHGLARDFDLHTNFTFWQQQSLYFVRTCKAFVILMLPGWKESVGVKAEKEEAWYWGRPIHYIDPDRPTEIFSDPECTEHAKTFRQYQQQDGGSDEAG